MLGALAGTAGPRSTLWWHLGGPVLALRGGCASGSRLGSGLALGSLIALDSFLTVCRGRLAVAGRY